MTASALCQQEHQDASPHIAAWTAHLSELTIGSTTTLVWNLPADTVVRRGRVLEGQVISLSDSRKERE